MPDPPLGDACMRLSSVVVCYCSAINDAWKRPVKHSLDLVDSTLIHFIAYSIESQEHRYIDT